jgi:hypothetical protein
VILTCGEANYTPPSSPPRDQTAGGNPASTDEPALPSNLDQTISGVSASAEDLSQSLVVSSHALRLSSEVFKRMLDQSMREGIEFNTTGSTTIPLPEDSAEAMKVICYIIHHRNSLVSRAINVSLLYVIAVLSDKYFFREALYPTATTWVRDYTPANSWFVRILPKQTSLDTWTKVLLAAHLFRHGKLAQKAMQSLTFCCLHPAQDHDSINTHRYTVPPDLLGK